MNVNDGRINEIDPRELEMGWPKDSIGIDKKDMTKKQFEDNQVSINDHTSALGKQLTQERANRKLRRNDPCNCGSGLKYKKCCLNN